MSKAEIGTSIRKAADLLNKGELVAIPTETVYGLAGNGLNEDAVAKIFTAKNRPRFDPLILHTDDLSKIEKLVKPIPDVVYTLASQFMPGPLSILMERNHLIPDIVTAGLPKVAIRIPNHPLTLELLNQLDFPVAAPSANPFGYISPTNAQHVYDQLGTTISYILDGGQCQTGVESTILDIEENTITVLRKGGTTIEDIESIVGKVKVKTKSTSNPKAPGMLISHYAPRTPLSITDTVSEALLEYLPEEVGYLGFDTYTVELPETHQRLLALDGQLPTAAKNLFSHLRELDTLNLKIIIAQLVPEEGLGRAINDKLRRANTQK